MRGEQALVAEGLAGKEGGGLSGIFKKGHDFLVDVAPGSADELVANSLVWRSDAGGVVIEVVSEFASVGGPFFVNRFIGSPVDANEF